MMRDRPVGEALAVLQELLAMGAPLLGLGLDSAELGHPPGDFAAVYDAARSAGLHLVAHAGEEGPPDYVSAALDLLGVERIDHGIRSLEDPHLVDRLALAQTPLTVCPLSNVRLRAVDTMNDHPLPEMLKAGLRVSINSDDPAYFGGYIDDNVRAVAQTFGLTRTQLAQLADNAVRSAFLSDERRAELLAEVAGWLADSS
jgi:adenosine deaminase